MGDPIVDIAFCGRRLLMPLSHQLPYYARADPAYSLNLGRIYESITHKYGDVPVIDIGANIGDSAAILTQHGSPQILCVEGEPRFLTLLERNVRMMTPLPIIESVFLSAPPGSTSAQVARGTAKLHGAHGAGPIHNINLEDVLSQHPQFATARLLKVDTDGMDLLIIRGALSWVARQKPVLFFEYDPDLQKEHGGGGLSLLYDLYRLGYSTALIYDNKGDYMLTAHLDDQRLLTDIDAYFTGRHSRRYIDICAFHAADQDVADTLRTHELAFFAAQRAE